MTQGSSTLIGLAGRKGSGKDTLASVLTAQGFENVKFAGGLKAMLERLLSYQGVAEDDIARMIEGDLKEEASAFLCGQTPRTAMRTLGDEWGRTLIGTSLWTTAAINKLATTQKAVVTDVRYPNECELIRQLGGVVIRVTAKGEVVPDDAHASEALIDTLEVDADFENDKSKGILFEQGRFAGLLMQLKGGVQ